MIGFKTTFLSAMLCLLPLTAHSEVKLLELDWGSQRVLTYALGGLIEAKGVDVSYVHTPAISQWFYLTTGQADVQVEIWEGTMGAQFDALLSKGYIELGATHLAKTREEWWYPSYVEKDCPKLPHWEALRECYKLFSNGGMRGIYYAGPWEKPDEARIQALSLPFDMIELKNADEITSTLSSMTSKQQPFLIFNWTPNWVDIAYNGSFIEFPQYQKECETKAEWGINPQMLWDCGNPKDGWMKIAVSTSLSKKSKCASEIIASFQLTNEDVAQAAYLVDYQGKSIQDAASKWLAINEHRVQGWTGHPSCER